MSQPKARKQIGFNSTQIKDGWIVRINKDGSIRAKLEPYVVNHPKKVK